MSTKNILSKVTRPYKITVKYQDVLGNYYTKSFKEFEAIVLSHEIDHLDGILHTDRADIIYMNVSESEREIIRKNYPLVILNKTKDFSYKETLPIRLIYKTTTNQIW